MQKFLYCHIKPNNGCYQHRIIWPFRWLATDFPELDIDLSVTDPIGDFSYYLYHGMPPIADYTYIGGWKRKGAKWILSIDDDYFNIPQWSTARLNDEKLDLFYNCYDLADVILTSTPALAKAVNRPNKTYITPNLMQVDDYGVNTVAPLRDKEILRIVWSGSTTHAGDFVDAESAIDGILTKWKGRVEFIFMGYCPGNLIKKWIGNGIHYENGTTLSVYPKVLQQMRPHISLAPLAKIPFNSSKSNIRVLEAWSLASAVIATNYGEYNVIENGKDGLLASSSADWFNCLDKLISDNKYREQLAANGRKRVEQFDWKNATARQPWNVFINELKQLSSYKPWSQ